MHQTKQVLSIACVLNEPTIWQSLFSLLYKRTNLFYNTSVLLWSSSIFILHVKQSYTKSVCMTGYTCTCILQSILLAVDRSSAKHSISMHPHICQWPWLLTYYLIYQYCSSSNLEQFFCVLISIHSFRFTRLFSNLLIMTQTSNPENQ